MCGGEVLWPQAGKNNRDQVRSRDALGWCGAGQCIQAVTGELARRHITPHDPRFGSLCDHLSEQVDDLLLKG